MTPAPLKHDKLASSSSSLPINTDSPLSDKSTPNKSNETTTATATSTNKARPYWREDGASYLSYILMWWLNPLMHLGRQRPLEDVDLPDVRTDMTGDNEYARFTRYWNEELQVNQANAKEDEHWQDHCRTRAPTEQEANARALSLKKRRQPSIIRALNRAYGLRFWGAAIAKLGTDACQFVLPVLLQMLLNWLQDSFGTNPPEEKQGYLLGMGMFLVAVGGILFANEFYRTSSVTGIRVRTALITSIYQKSLRLSPSARANMNSGQIVSMMSIDCSKIDLMFQFFHMGWTGIFTLGAAIGLLVHSLGVATAVAIGVLFVFMPLQGNVMKKIGGARADAVKKTDERMKVMTEILHGIRVIKLYAWERPFVKRLFEVRNEEMDRISRGLYARSINNIINIWSPSLMMLLTYMTYYYTNNGISDAAAVFSSMVLLGLLRMPLVMLPFALSATADALVGFGRVQKFLLAEELNDAPTLLTDANYALKIVNGEFNWDAVLTEQQKEKNEKNGKTQELNSNHQKPKVNSSKEEVQLVHLNGHRPENGIDSKANVGNGHSASKAAETSTVASPKIRSAVRNVSVEISKGKLIAVVGSVGCGKSSLLSGILGEMKRVAGDVYICGQVAYVAQQAWIQNTTLKQNILFGEEFNAKKYERAIEVCALKHDISVLPAGDQTEIGERGINLSGGQKQRVSIARAVYHDADIYLFDDPLSAVDAHVSKHIFFNCITGALAGKTRVLVTHQLQYMPNVDEIFYMEDGEIAEKGSYTELMTLNGKFAALMQTYGGRKQDDQQEEKNGLEQNEQKSNALKKTFNTDVTKLKDPNTEKGVLISGEERSKGGLKTETLIFYVQQCGGWWALAIFMLLFCLMIGTSLYSQTWLNDWVNQSYDISASQYIGVYGGLTGVQLIFCIVAMRYVANRSLYSARRLHDMAFGNVMRAPMSFFDTSPAGRVLNRFSRDQDVVDSVLLSESIRLALYMLMNLAGMLILIAVYNYWFAIAIPFLVYLYNSVQSYYRSTSRELKRLDAIARSPLFAHFSETLTGLSTIRAYQRQQMFIQNNYSRIDANNRPYFVLQCGQRWLGERLELIGAFVILLTAILGVAARHSLNSASLGLSLSYSVQLTQILSWLVRQLVEAENNMNAVERAKFYSDAIAQERPANTDEDKVVEAQAKKSSKQWPDKGEIVFKDFSMRYRDGLPLVLDKINVKIVGGERVGVVGRTGAGKSSLMLALFRLVEAASGEVFIDGVKLDKLGLEFLRSRLAIIPQDAVLYSGTVRSNLDPFNQYEDRKLWNVLEKVYMKDAISKLPDKLEAAVSENGGNFSAGQRAQISLARAILRDTKILVMDEATASIDLETDWLIQSSIRKEFQCTILTIAHRLNTIVDYDRVMVLSNGQIAEYDRPALLLRNPKSILSQLVDETGESNAIMLREMAENAFLGKSVTPAVVAGLRSVSLPSSPEADIESAGLRSMPSSSSDDEDSSAAEPSQSYITFHSMGF